jgi:hypothetical protein
MFVGIDAPERPFVEKAKIPGAEDASLVSVAKRVILAACD